jgi:hypothetical protein
MVDDQFDEPPGRPESPIRVHVDVLGWLFVCSGLFGVLTGASLAVLAWGTSAALASLGGRSGLASPTVWFLGVSALACVLGGLAMALVGRALVRRGRMGRRAALLLAVPNLLVIPFGTALGVYTFWTLLNDEARAEFGRASSS